MKYLKLLIVLAMITYNIEVFASQQNNQQKEDKLEDAIMREDVEKVEHLITLDTNVNVKDKQGFTPLMYAAGIGNIEIIRLLIKAGADVNIKNNYGDTALMRATEVGKNIDQIIDIFISNGANIEEKDKKGWTVILIAASNRNIEMVRELIKRGANVYEKNNDSIDILTTATVTSDVTIVKFILENNYYRDINSVNKHSITPLMLAVMNRSKEIIELLMKAGANVNCIDKFGKTAIDYASEDKDIKAFLLNMSTTK